MKITAITSFSVPVCKPNENHKYSLTPKEFLGTDNLNLMPNYISFTAKNKDNTRAFEDTKMYNEYKLDWDGSPYEYLKQKEASVSEITEFLNGITKNEELSKTFIEEINSNPRQADKITKVLIDKLGGPANFQKWYWGKEGYVRAYEKYYKENIFNNKDVSVNDMIKISPNLMVETLIAKNIQVNGTPNFVIGNVPEDIGNVEDFREIVDTIRKSKLVKEFIKYKDSMSDTDEFFKKNDELIKKVNEYIDNDSDIKSKPKLINPARMGKDFIKQVITLYNKTKNEEAKRYLEKNISFVKYMKETNVTVNGKHFTYVPHVRPYSTKLLFDLQPEGTENKYFAAMEMYDEDGKTCKSLRDKENSMMRSDSPFLNGLFGYYLLQNGCKNVPPVQFYDYKSDTVVYSFINGDSEKPSDDRIDKAGVIPEFDAKHKEMKPVTDLNVFITDCFFENFMKDKKTGETLIVDNGHAKFSNALKPAIKFLQMNYGDIYGRDFVSADASIYRAMFE